MIPGQRQVDADLGKIIGSAVAVVALVSGLIPIRAFAQSSEFKRLPPVSAATASEGGATGVVAAPQTTPMASPSAAATPAVSGVATAGAAPPTPAASASHGTAGVAEPPVSHGAAVAPAASVKPAPPSPPSIDHVFYGN